MALQNIADPLITDLVPQISQRPRNPVITPVTVLLGHANDQLLDLSTDPRPARASTGLQAILRATNFRYQARMVSGRATLATSPRILRPIDDRSRQARLARRPRASAALSTGPSGCVFGGQIFIPRQQLLAHRPGDVGQDARPIHSSSTPADSRLIAPKIVASAARYAGNGQLTVFSTVFNFLTKRNPNAKMIAHYCKQVSEYRRHTGAKRALLVLMTPGKIIEGG
jgi:hypothetical protein